MRLSGFAGLILVCGLMCSSVFGGPVDFEAKPVGDSFDESTVSTGPDAASSKAQAGPDFTEYLYGVGSYNAYLVKIDHDNGTVCSADLFPSETGSFYGAASSGDPDYFWATSGSHSEYGLGSALYKVYPAEKAVVPVGTGYGQNPRYPGDPAYSINMRELAYNDDTGVLYGTDYLGLYTIDTAAGTASRIRDFGNGVDGEPIDYVFSMEYDRLGQMLYITNQKIEADGFTRGATHLYTVDMTTAVPTYVGDAGVPGLTDLYQSHLSDQMFASANLDNRLLQVDPLTGAAVLRGNIADNMLGLSGEFLEVPGPQVWFQGPGGRPSVTVYSELNGVRETDSASTGSGWDRNCSAQAFVQEAGQPNGIGQQTDIYSRITYNHDLSTSYFDIDVDFASIYNGGGMYGTGGASVDITWRGTLFVIPDDTYPFGTRVLVLVDGNQIVNDLVSDYVLDFEMKIYDSHIEEPVVLLTEDDIPGDSSPFLGAFYTTVNYPSYTDAYQVEMKLTLDIGLPAGDVNADGIVNIFDFETVAASWLNQSCESSNLWCNGGDVNQDSSVGIEDLAVFAGSWLQGKGWGASNSFNYDMGVVFRSIAIPETLQTLNDECADAVRIVPGTEYFGTTATATATGTDISSCNYNDIYDVWYKFTPQEDGIYEVYARKCGAENFSPCISLYDSCGGTELVCWPNWLDMRLFEASAWTDYYIRVADYDGSRGDFKLAVIYHPTPDNDNCDNPTPVYEGVKLDGNTLGAVNDSSSSCGYGDDSDVWYSFTPDSTGNYALTLEPNNEYNFNVSIFNNDCSEATRQELACANGNDFFGWPVTQFGFNAVQGETYLIRVAGNDGYAGEFSLYIEPGPENDTCQNAIELTMWDSQYSSTLGATGTDITSCGTDDSIDVWYSYTAEYDQMVMFEVFDDDGMGFPLTVAVFDTCGGTELACAESASECYEGGCSGQAIYQISAGEKVYVRVAFGESLTGGYQINVNEITPPGNDECIDAEFLDEWAYGSTVGSSGYDESTCGGPDDVYDVWYTFTPTATDYYYISVETVDMPFQGTLSISDGGCGSSLNEINCTDVYEYGELYLELLQDQTYYIRVASFDGTQTGFDVIATSDYYGGD